MYILAHDTARRRAVQAVQEAPEGWVVRISEPKRNLEQNAKFHAICGDFAKTAPNWAGKKRSLPEWKVILVSGHAAATGQREVMIEGLEGEAVILRESTAAMVKSRMTSLIEYAQAIGSELGVRFSDGTEQAAKQG